MNRPPRADEGRGWDSQTATITTAYSLAWALMLLNGGLYWDDWCLVGLSWPASVRWGLEAGHLWQPVLWWSMDRLPGGWYTAHAITFALFLAAALLLNRILRRTRDVDELAQVAIPLIFAVFPVNSARLAHIDLMYTVSVAAFYLAWYLLVVDLETPNLTRRLSSAALFLWAMLTTKSLLMLFAMVAMHVVWVTLGDLRDRDERRYLLRTYFYFLALPFVDWAIHKSWTPYGLYKGYHTISDKTVSVGLSGTWTSLWESLFRPILSAWPAVLVVVVLTWFWRRRAARWHGRMTEAVVWIAAGALGVWLAIFPYLAVGKIPSAAGPEWWDSRHQVLVPLGAALFVYGLVSLAASALRLRRSTATLLIAALVATFVVADIGFNLRYQADWYKQVALMHDMRSSTAFRKGNVFVVRDNVTGPMVHGRRYLPYELSGMLYSVFGDSTRFALDEQLPSVYATQMGAFADHAQYHWQNLRPPAVRYRVVIAPGTTDLTRLPTLLHTMWSERFDRREFDSLIEDVLSLSATRLP